MHQDQQYEIRKDIVRLLKKGHKPNAVAEMLDVSRGYVYLVRKSFEEEGIDGIRPGKRGRRQGEKRILTPEQEQEIVRAITDRHPEQVKGKGCLWTRRAVGDYILREYGMEIALSTLGIYLSRWGFSIQRPVKRANRQDEARMETWMREEYPAIAAKAKAENAEICWGAQTALQNTADSIQADAPAGKTPVPDAGATSLKLTMLSAVSNQGLLRFAVTKEPVDEDILIDFMSRLITDTRQKVLLILDDPRVRRAGKVAAWLADHQGEIELFFLPPHPPE